MMFTIYIIVIWVSIICFLNVYASMDFENTTTVGTYKNTSGISDLRQEKMGPDVFRQLLNQETLIRMALVKNVNSLMQDMVSLKDTVLTVQSNMDRITKEVNKLTKASMDEIRGLKRENSRLKNELLAEINKKNNQTVSDMQDGFLELTNDQKQHEQEIRDNTYLFQKNTSTVLTDLEASVRILSMGLVNVDKQTQDLTKRLHEADESLPEKINGKFRTVTETVKNISYQLSEQTNESIHTLQSELDESHQRYLRLSAAVLSLEWLKNNISRRCDTQQQIGFTAGLSFSSSSWSSGILIFDKVLFNRGNGYDPTSGKFTAPSDGVYIFYISTTSYDTQNIKVDITLNGKTLVTAWGNGEEDNYDDYYYNRYQTGTNMAVTALKVGDNVWVQHRSGSGVHSDSVPITTFSGFMI